MQQGLLPERKGSQRKIANTLGDQAGRLRLLIWNQQPWLNCTSVENAMAGMMEEEEK